MKKDKQLTTGFTLIELLVVIAIIALLVSILLPSLNKAKDLAREVVCMSNVKSISLALMMYTENADGYFPRTRHKHRSWPEWLAEYELMESNEPYFCPNDTTVDKNEDPAMYNMSIGGNEAGPIPSSWYHNINIDQTTAEKILICDSADSTEYPSPWRIAVGGIWDSRYWPSERHNGGSNVAYCDGHVEKKSFDEIMPENTDELHDIWYISQEYDPNGGW